MRIYKPEKLRPGAKPRLAIGFLVYLLNHWPLYVIAALLISPVGPHLRIQYTYRDYGGHKHMIACDYLGSRGFVRFQSGEDCPVIAMIDTRDLETH